jgi:hypothetical protein
VKVVRDFTGNDIYFMEVVSDKVVVNDGYEGVHVLDGELNTVWRPRVMDGLMIYTSFVNGPDLVLHCVENDCLVHLNVDTGQTKVIPLTPGLCDTAFLPLYGWAGDDLVLSVGEGLPEVRVRISGGAIVEAEASADIGSAPSVRDTWNSLKQGGASVHRVYPERRLALVEVEGRFEAVCLDDWSRKPLGVAAAPFHDLEAFGGYVAQVDESGIVLSDGGTSMRLAPEPSGYVFLRGKFLPDAKGAAFITLASNDANVEECRISRYLLGTGLSPR